MIYTSQFAYKGEGRLDITVAAQTPFSPTWKMVGDYKAFGKKAKYTFYYHQRMQRSYRDNFKYWKDVLDKSTKSDIVLVCYCKAGEFCHRLLLAEYLQKCGAQYGGERNRN